MLMIKGTIKTIDIEERLITVSTRKRVLTLYIQRAMFNRYMTYLEPNHMMVANTKIHHDTTKQNRMYTVKDIIKIVKPTPRRTIILYSHDTIINQTKHFVNSLKNTLFLDLEMSMHPYYKDPHFVQEIIQAGYVLVDSHGNIIEKYMAFIQPTKHKKLTKRTLKFLDLTQDDIDKGIPYDTFYQHFKQLLKTYNPAIIVWGKNDALALKETANVNDLPNINDRSRFVNLLKLHKNVFKLKNDLGLLKANQLYGYPTDTQRHDALEDAEMTKRIFDGFKAYLNDSITIDKTLL
ncbi:MAG: exonuclease domain-containing protein [Bacillota bacterium]